MSHTHIYPLYISAGRPHVCLHINNGEIGENPKSANCCRGCHVCNTFAATYRASMHTAALWLTVSSPALYRQLDDRLVHATNNDHWQPALIP
jgi:hypothetical protein